VITVASVLWVGAFKNRRYSPIWVQRLKAMVARNLSLPHRFVCLSNVEVPGVEVVPLRQRWPGWWAKLELFGHDLGSRVLYLDLDVLVTGSLDEIALHPAPMIFAPPHNVLMGQPDAKAPKGVTYKYQTSCMAWSPPEGREIFDKFRPELAGRFAGDQDWIAHAKPGCPTFPAEWFRKLRQCPEGPPPGVKLVLCMPDKNDVASRKYPWVKGVWTS
jgi:hypothetical protein